LGAPPDHADPFDALQRLGELGEQMPTPAHIALGLPGELEGLDLEMLRREGLHDDLVQHIVDLTLSDSAPPR
jgi:hypothetical protein